MPCATPASTRGVDSEVNPSPFQMHCVQCNKPLPSGYRAFCDVCPGLIDVRYDTDRASLRDSSNPYDRFGALLPVRDGSLLPRDAVYTPTVHAKGLGKYLGMPSLYLKNETVLPTGTTKDRMAAVSLAFLYEQGVREFCASSTGNSSTSYARQMAAFPEMKLNLFTGEDWVDRVSYADKPQVKHFGLRGGTFVDAGTCASAYAAARGCVSEQGFFNLGRREGLKLTYLEATDQIDRPIDWYVQAVSSAMGVYGAFKGAKELMRMGHVERLPRLLCVQQETCAPMTRAFQAGLEKMEPGYIIKQPTGIAKAILRGDPTRTYPVMRRVVAESKGTFAMVSEAEIRQARKLVEDLEGVSPCFAASAAIAGVIRLKQEDQLPGKDTVLINLTGSDRPPVETSRHVNWLVRNGEAWVPEQ